MRVRATGDIIRPVLPVQPRTENRHRPARAPVATIASPPPRSGGVTPPSGLATAVLAQELWQRISIGDGPVRPGVHREASLAYRRARDRGATTLVPNSHFDSLV